MKKKQMMNTDLVVSPFGLGTADAGTAWKEEEADRIIGTYLELGGNLIDTAHVYSDWIPPETARSERLYGGKQESGEEACDVKGKISCKHHPDPVGLLYRTGFSLPAFIWDRKAGTVERGGGCLFHRLRQSGFYGVKIFESYISF